MEYKSNKAGHQFTRPIPSMMDRWIDQKEKLKKKFPSLTDKNLRYKEGKKNEMFENLRIKLDISVDDWKKMMEDI